MKTLITMLAAALIATACAPQATFSGDREAEIQALERHVTSLIPGTWEQVAPPRFNGLGCRLRDCVRYSVIYQATDEVTCRHVHELLNETQPNPPDADQDNEESCTAYAVIDGAVTRLGFDEDLRTVTVSVNYIYD